jgi:hypothetical protein
VFCGSRSHRTSTDRTDTPDDNSCHPGFDRQSQLLRRMVVLGLTAAVVLLAAVGSGSTLVFCPFSSTGSICTANLLCANATGASPVVAGACQAYGISVYIPTLQRNVAFPSWILFQDPGLGPPRYGLKLSLGALCEPDGAVTAGFCSTSCCTFAAFGFEDISPVFINGTVWAGFAPQQSGGSDVGLVLGLLFGLGVPIAFVAVLVGVRYRRNLAYFPLEERGHHEDL